MSYFQALWFGLVEGITEYLPVSSTGHLLLVTQISGLQQTEGQKAFEIVVQGGAILAVVGAYWNGVSELLRGLVGQSPAGLRLLLKLLVAFTITSVLGLAFQKRIEAHLFNLWTVSIAWIIGGFAIFGVEAWRKRFLQPPTERGAGGTLNDLTWQGAFIIGLMQSLALCPGVSRSLVTLVGGLIVGLSFHSALEFSFLLGGVTLLAATGYKGLESWSAIRSTIDTGPALVAIAAATVSAWLCVRWMLRSLERYGLAPFGWYRIALGVIVIGLLARGVIEPK